ncbi:MAG: DUF882 domain-containing protein [Polyangia bacterium]
MKTLALGLLVGSWFGGSVAHAEAADGIPARVATLVDRDDENPDKKSAWLREKASRVQRKVPPPQKLPEHPLCLRNLWVDEVLPLSATWSETQAQAAFDHITRDHFTQAETHMAPALLPLVRRAAANFHAPLVEIVSGFRAAKYQLMLRKKGHEVARDSEHPRGEAVDFRLPEVPTQALLAFVKKQHLGGVGYYPVSQFVHADVGPVRYWRGH